MPFFRFSFAILIPDTLPGPGEHNAEKWPAGVMALPTALHQHDGALTVLEESIRGLPYGERLRRQNQFLSGGVSFTEISLKDGEVLDGWWDSYPLGRHARVTIPID